MIRIYDILYVMLYGIYLVLHFPIISPSFVLYYWIYPHCLNHIHSPSFIGIISILQLYKLFVPYFKMKI